jgi:hypothetical protein
MSCLSCLKVEADGDRREHEYSCLIELESLDLKLEDVVCWKDAIQLGIWVKPYNWRRGRC